MRCLLLSVSRAALFCFFVAILRVHALVVIPSEALPQRHPTLDADDALSERGPPDWDWELATSHPPGPLPVPPIPTMTRLLPSHAPWYTQAETTATPLGHAPGTQRILEDGTHAEEDKAPPRSPHRFPSWAARANDRESDPRRRRTDRADEAGGQYTSEESKVSVLAVAVVGVVLACHYLDYL